MPSSVWITNARSGELVPAEVDWLIGRLFALNRDADLAQVVECSFRIFSALMQLRGRVDNIGHTITGEERTHIKRHVAKAGLKNDLLRLRQAARSRSELKYRKVWLAVSGKTRAALRVSVPPVIERRYDDQGRLIGFRRAPVDINTRTVAASIVQYGRKDIPTRLRFQSFAPSIDVVLPMIDAALDVLNAVGSHEGRKRKADDVANAFSEAVYDSHVQITGTEGITRNSILGRWEGTLAGFKTEIEDRFGVTLTINSLREA